MSEQSAKEVSYSSELSTSLGIGDLMWDVEGLLRDELADGGYPVEVTVSIEVSDPR